MNVSAMSASVQRCWKRRRAMLKAIISHNEQTAIVELPMDRLSLQYELSQIGIRRQA